MNITTDELLEAIQAALGPATQEGMTVMDLVTTTGWSRTKITEVLVRLNAEGKLDVVRVKRKCLDGRMQSIPAYRLK